MKTRIMIAAMAGLLLAGSTYAQESTNSIVGVGLQVGTSSDHKLAIMGVISNTPAAVAGLMPGEIVERIDGTPTAGKDLKQCVDMIRGPAATPVTLDIVDPKDGTSHIVTLMRETITIPSAPATKR
jgi:carboxyl-terminal processing protease